MDTRGSSSRATHMLVGTKRKRNTRGTPSVLDGYISSPQLPGQASLPQQVSELNALLAAEKAKEETLKKKMDELRVRETIWGADVENLSLEELKVVESRLLKFMADMAAKADQPIVSSSDEEMTTRDASGISVPNIGTSSRKAAAPGTTSAP